MIFLLDLIGGSFAARGTTPGQNHRRRLGWTPLNRLGPPPAEPAASALWPSTGLAAGHLQGPKNSVSQAWTTPFLWYQN